MTDRTISWLVNGAIIVAMVALVAWIVWRGGYVA